MEGLCKKAFDFSQIAHMYGAIQHFDPYIAKQVMTGAGSWGTTEATKRFFGRRGGNLLNTGIEMGKNNQQMSPYTSTLARNFLGSSKMKPYDEGIQIGNEIRNKGLTGDDELKYIQGVIDQKAQERAKLEAAGQKVKDPILKAYDKYETGSFQHNPVFNKFINAGAISQDDKALGHRAIAHGISAPIAKVVDPTAIARPIISKAESNPKVNEQLQKAFPQGTMREKAYSKVRNFID